VLLKCPDIHLTDCDHKEQMGRPGHGQDRDRQPRQRLKEVVGARHEIESIATGDIADTGARRTKVTEGDMGMEVGQLSKDVQSNASIDQSVAPLAQLGASGVPGTVDPVGEVQARQQMVVSTVLEYVAEGHCSVRETMDKHGLVLALQEVKHHHPVSDTKTIRWKKKESERLAS